VNWVMPGMNPLGARGRRPGRPPSNVALTPQPIVQLKSIQSCLPVIMLLGSAESDGQRGFRSVQWYRGYVTTVPSPRAGAEAGFPGKGDGLGSWAHGDRISAPALTIAEREVEATRMSSPRRRGFIVGGARS